MPSLSSLASDLAQLLAAADDPRAELAQLLIDIAVSLNTTREREGDVEGDRRRQLARDLELFGQQLRERDRQPLALREEIARFRERVVRSAVRAAKNNVS